jgi:hypothetical protein
MIKFVTSVPRIVTASWYSILPAEFVRVGISRGAPRGHPAGYRRYRPLYPGRWFRSVSPEEYVLRYNAEILAPLDPHQVIEDLRRFGAGSSIALLCFERPGTSDGWCHRALAAGWLARALDQPIGEFEYEHLPQDEHPMLPPHLSTTV